MENTQRKKQTQNTVILRLYRSEKMSAFHCAGEG